jgi:hypothetical protein
MVIASDFYFKSICVGNSTVCSRFCAAKVEVIAESINRTDQLSSYYTVQFLGQLD